MLFPDKLIAVKYVHVINVSCHIFNSFYLQVHEQTKQNVYWAGNWGQLFISNNYYWAMNFKNQFVFT